MMTRTEALAQGYTIDDHASGRPIAYKGPRFQPTEFRRVLTDLEAELLGELKELAAFSGEAITTLDLKTYGEARSHLKVINQACARLYAKLQEAGE